MKVRKILSSLLALVLIAALLTSSAFAATWYLEDGDITVSAGENGQTVQQGSNAAVADNDVTITQRDSSTATSNTITVSTTGDAEAEITIKDINIDSGSESAIDVGDSNLHLTAEGDNKLTADGDSAALHVSSGDLTIDGSGSLTAEHEGRDDLMQDSARIGSNAGEDLSGSIHITGDVTVTTGGDGGVYTDPYQAPFRLSGGAGIGAGAGSITRDENGTLHTKSADLTGTVTIDGNAVVNADAGNICGAGIGTGYAYRVDEPQNRAAAESTMSGTISIGGNAKVTATGGDEDGAGIGSGCDSEMSGTISIGDNAAVTAMGGDDGAGIGSGDDGSMSGTISIGGKARVDAIGGRDGAGIGSGNDGTVTKTGVISIGGDAVVNAFSKEDGAGIGSGNDDFMYGTIRIFGNAVVNASSAECGAGIGAGDDGKVKGFVIITDNAKVVAASGLDGAGIGCGCSDSFYSGAIIISGSANVTARIACLYDTTTSDYYTDCKTVAAAIGSADNGFGGNILILGNSSVTTEIIDRASVSWDNLGGTLGQHNKDLIGSIGAHVVYYYESPDGRVFISDTAKVNGLPGTDTDGINAYINGGYGTDLIPAQVDTLPDGTMKLIIEKEGYTVSDTLYGGSTELPTVPGTYFITVTVTTDEESFDVVLGTIVIPEPEPEPGPEPEQETETGTYVPLYRVTDRNGKDISYEKELSDGVLTLTVEAGDAKLVLRSGALDTLRVQGIEKIVFVTAGARSAFTTADAAALGSGELILTHSGSEVSAALAGKALGTAAFLIKE